MYPPIELTLYDKNDQAIETFSRATIPWGLLKKAVILQQQFEAAEKNVVAAWQFWNKSKETTKEEAQMTAISQFVVELFGNKFTVKQLEDGADIGEVMTVFHAVISRANATVKANPTHKPSSRK